MLKPFTHEDFKPYEALSQEFYNSDATYRPVPTEHFQRTFDEICANSPLAKGWLITSTQGQVAGYALASLTWSCEFGGKVAWLEELYIRPEFRKLKLGYSSLVEIINQLSQEDKVKGFRLEVAPANSKVEKIYENLGFTKVPYHQFWLAV
ncbi:MAG: GNAT family N-acetyltransferase [Candidatus Adiutrix sp.]